MTTKMCSKCKQEKALTQFYNEKRVYCIECERKMARARMKRYNATFKGKAMAALNSSRKAVRKIEKETGRKIKDDLTFFDVAMVLDQPECAYCGKQTPTSKRTIDHITPLRYGGDNTFSNITMACRSCNSRKNDIPAFEYCLQQGMPFEEFEQIVDKIAQRKRISFGAAFKRLVEDMGVYYEAMLEQERKKIS